MQLQGVECHLEIAVALGHDLRQHLCSAVFGCSVNVGFLNANVEWGKTVWVLQIVRWLDGAAFSAMCSCFPEYLG